MGAAYSKTETVLTDLEQPSLTPRAWSHSWYESSSLEKGGVSQSTSPQFLLPSTLRPLAEGYFNNGQEDDARLCQDLRCDKSQQKDKRTTICEEDLRRALGPQSSTFTEDVRCDKSQRKDDRSTFCEEELRETWGPQSSTFTENVRCDKSQREDDRQILSELEPCDALLSETESELSDNNCHCNDTLLNEEGRCNDSNGTLNVHTSSELKSTSRPPLRFPTIDIQAAQRHNPFIGSGNEHTPNLKMVTPSTCDESESNLNMTPREGYSGIADFDDSDDSQFSSSCSESEFYDDDENDDDDDGKSISNLYFSLNDSSDEDEEDKGGDLADQYTFDLAALAAALKMGTSTADLEQHVRDILLSARGKPQEALGAMLSARGKANQVNGALLSARGKAPFSARAKGSEVNEVLFSARSREAPFGALLSARGRPQEADGILLSARGQAKYATRRKPNGALLSARGQPSEIGGALLSARGQSKEVNGVLLSSRRPSKEVNDAPLSARAKSRGLLSVHENPQHAKPTNPVFMKCIFTPRFVRKSFGGAPEDVQSLDQAVRETVAAAKKLYRRSLTDEQSTAQSAKKQTRKSSIVHAPTVREE